jgi:RNA polymerase sigma-70 factor (ECF subfamily)
MKNQKYTNKLENEIKNLQRLAFRITKEESMAEDLLQDTMVLALRFQNSYKNETNLRAWLTQIMKNRHNSLIRRKNLENKIYNAEANYTISKWSIGEMSKQAFAMDSSEYKGTGFSDDILLLLKSLNQNYKRVVELCDIEGLSYAEAAKMLDCPEGTVMSRLHRGRRELRRQLACQNLLTDAA